MVTAVLLSALAAWHPIHSSSATLVVEEGAKHAEVVIRVWAEDFPPGTDSAAAEAYLQGRFRVYHGTAPLPVTLTGLRPERDRLFLTVTVPVRDGCHGLRVWHRVLMERFADQVNLLQARCGRRVLHLVFTSRQEPRPL